MGAKFKELHSYKYGSDGGTKPKEFNVRDEKNPYMSCVVTDESLRLCTKNGRQIGEIDLDRVVGARPSQKGEKQLEVSLSMGRTNKCTIISVALDAAENTPELAKEIRERASK